MGTKNKPGKFDCYESAEPDEPMFVLLARDPLAPYLAKIWADVREALIGDKERVAEARSCEKQMRKWKSANPTKGKAGSVAVPDNLHELVIQAIIQSYFQGQIEEEEK